MAIYSLSYELAPTAPMHTQLLAFVKENRHVKQWLHPYAGLFLLKTDADVWTLSESFRAFFTDNISHMVLPITQETAGGIMPQYVWTWMSQSDQASVGGLLTKYLEEQKPE